MFNRAPFDRTPFNRPAGGAYVENLSFGVQSSISKSAAWVRPAITLSVTSAFAKTGAWSIPSLNFTSYVISGSIPPTYSESLSFGAVSALAKTGAWIVPDISFTAYSGMTIAPALSLSIAAMGVQGAFAENVAWSYIDLLIAATTSLDKSSAWVSPEFAIGSNAGLTESHAQTGALSFGSTLVLEKTDAWTLPSINFGSLVNIVTAAQSVLELSINARSVLSTGLDWTHVETLGAATGLIQGNAWTHSLTFGAAGIPAFELDAGCVLVFDVEGQVTKTLDWTLPAITFDPETVVTLTRAFGASLVLGVQSSFTVSSVLPYLASLSFSVANGFRLEPNYIFAGIEIENFGKWKPTMGVIVTDTVLLSGRHSIQSSNEVILKSTIEGLVPTTTITNLLSKVGVKSTLTVGGIDYRHCRITGNFKIQESGNPSWYFVTFDIAQEA